MQKGDICQEVCPFNQRRATTTSEPAFQPRPITVNTKLTDLLYATQRGVQRPVQEAARLRGRSGGKLLRTAAAALAGRNDSEAIGALEHALEDPEELVREAAAWSLHGRDEQVDLP